MAKRRGANGTGNMYYDAKRDLYIYRVSVYGEDGQLKRKQFAGKTQEAATEKYRRWEHHGAFLSVDPNIRMKEWAERWFGEYSQKIEESTIPGYRNTLNHIIRFFGNRRVDSMRAADIEYCIEEMAKAYSVSRCKKMRTMLGQILRKAEANGLIAKNPVPLADRMNYRRMGKKRGRKAAFTAPEVLSLMQGLPDTRIGHSIRLMLATGISTQELLGLSTFDITPDGSRVSVRRAVKLREGGAMYIGEVKAENRERDVDVPPVAQTSAKFLRENSNGFILAGKTKGMPLHPSTYRKFYKSAVQQVEGVRLLTPHCCRHTYISHLEDSGADFAVIQALAGQSTQSVTIAYIHPQSPAIASAVGSIESLLTGKNGVVGTLPAHKAGENKMQK